MDSLIRTAATADVDFLPASYCEHHQKRRLNLWQLPLAAGLAVFLGVANLHQLALQRRVDREVNALLPQYRATEEDKARLTANSLKLAQSEMTAELVTYLKHPWPRSQILSSLLSDLPDSVTLNSIQLYEAGPAGQAVAPPSGQGLHAEGGAVDASKLSRAERDIKTLRERHDASQVLIMLGGRTVDPNQLHAYLGELSRRPLFVKAELVSLENGSAAEPRSAANAKEGRFRARIVVRQGYGQPKGPKGPQEPSAHVVDAVDVNGLSRGQP